MKTIIKYAIFIVITCNCLVSCKQEKTTEEKTKSLKPKTIVVDWETCKDSSTYESHKLGSEEAIIGLSEYKDYIDNVKDTLTKYTPNAFPDMSNKLNYGSEVEFDMLLEVLAHRKFKCSDKLFLMNANRPKKIGNKIIEGEFVTEIMFVLESQDSLQKTTYTYFDFTRPCPNGCPENIPKLEYPINNIKKLLN